MPPAITPGSFGLLPIVVAAIGGVLAIILLWRGMHLLLWPIRVALRAVRASYPDLHPGAALAALVAAAVLVPAPFTYGLSMLLGLVRLLALDLPRLILTIEQPALDVCAGQAVNAGKCASLLNGAFSQAFAGPIGSWIVELKVPALWDWALLVFAVALTGMWMVQQGLARAHFAALGAFVVHPALYKTAALVLSLVGALYLCITAIVAIPVFNDRTANLPEIKKDLAEQMQNQPDQYDAQLRSAVLNTQPLNAAELDALRAQVRRLWTQPGAAPLGSSPDTSGAISPDLLKQFYREFLLSTVDDVGGQVSAWNRSTDELHRSAVGFKDAAHKFSERVVEYFTEENTGRIGGLLTQQHAAILAASYNLWLSAYANRLEACRSALLVGQDFIAERVSAITHDLAIRTAEGPPTGVPPILRSNRPTSSDGDLGFAAACANIVPPEADFLPQRRGPSDSLGLFGRMAKWLLATESRDLALITGLLGFGFFGALAASFIRQTAAQPGQVLPPAGWILPALIRGVAAAVLVFLAVVGGLAVFTQAGPEPAPNPYAVFFACFIAAVFSEDVWKWAREHGATGQPHLEPEGKGQQPAPTDRPVPPPLVTPSPKASQT
jgi:hypothetical protein